MHASYIGKWEERTQAGLTMVAKRRADGGDEIKKAETEREQKGGMGRRGPENRGRKICDEVGRCFKRDS